MAGGIYYLSFHGFFKVWVTSYEYEKMMINRNRKFLNGKNAVEIKSV